MKRKGSCLAIALLGGLLLSSCKSGPSRPNFFKGKSHDANKDDDSDDSTGMGKPKVDPTKGQEEGVDLVLTDDDSVCKDKPRGYGRKSLRLLTTAEYANSVKDILKITEDVSGRLTPESKINGFMNNVEANLVSADHANSFVEVAIALADSVKPSLQNLVGCVETAGESCAQKVIDVLGPKFFRRPLAAEEKSAALELYKKGAAQAPREGMTLLLTHFMTSPGFLYKSEVGDAQGQLDAYEVASALSYFFWGSVPDDALTASAASGKLLTEDGMKAEALRLWQSPRSRFVTDTFAKSWLESEKILGTNKDPAVGASLTSDIQKAMYAEINDTFDYLMRQPNGTFESLLGADFTLGSAALANYYGVPTLMDDGVSKINFSSIGKKGLVSLGGVMASHARSDESHPIKRGDMVLQKMLCFVPPPTPPGLEIVVPAKDPTKTTRERFAQHSQNPACAACHIKLDGVGFGMEDFDTLGRFRKKDLNGKDIDASGVIIESTGDKIEFNGAGDLSEKLGKSSEVKRCFAIQWYRFAHGRAMKGTDTDICATRDLAAKFAKGEFALKDLLLKIITDSSYTKRSE